MFFKLDKNCVWMFSDFCAWDTSLVYDMFSAVLELFFFLHSTPFLLLSKEIQMAADLRCCRCELVLDSAKLLQYHEASCYDTPPPRSRTRRWSVSLGHCRTTSSQEELSSDVSPPRKRTRRWCIPLTCSVSSSAPLDPRADALYRCIPLSREPLARNCTEREAHERYEGLMTTFFRMSGGLSDSMKQEPWYISGLQRAPHDRCGFYCGSFRRSNNTDC